MICCDVGELSDTYNFEPMKWWDHVMDVIRGFVDELENKDFKIYGRNLKGGEFWKNS